LASRVTRDVDAAGADAKRQIDELKSNTMRSLDTMRRVWHTATRAFSDTAVDPVQREMAEGKRAPRSNDGYPALKGTIPSGSD